MTALRVAGGPHGFQGEWEDFAELFLDGCVESGSYWEWYENWWAAKQANDDQILWVNFETLKTDLRGEVERIAQFMELPLEPAELDLVAEGSTFEAMKTQQLRIDANKEIRGARIKKNHIRKGKVGTWREMFDEDLGLAFDAKDCAHHANEWAKLM